MNVATVDEARLKDVVKTAVLEVFEERRDWLADLLSEAFPPGRSAVGGPALATVVRSGGRKNELSSLD